MNVFPIRSAALSCGCVALCLLGSLTAAKEPMPPPAVKIAVFDFELDDLSAVRILIEHQVLPVIAAQPRAEAACKIAEVNPVSGNAECVDPQGAPVEPAPPRDDNS